MPTIRLHSVKRAASHGEKLTKKEGVEKWGVDEKERQENKKVVG